MTDQLAAVGAQRHAAPRRRQLVRRRRHERARRRRGGAAAAGDHRRRPEHRCSSRCRRGARPALDDRDAPTRRAPRPPPGAGPRRRRVTRCTSGGGTSAIAAPSRCRATTIAPRASAVARRHRARSRRSEVVAATPGRLHVPGPGLAVSGHGRRALRDRAGRPRHHRRLLRDPPTRPRLRPARRALPVRRSPRAAPPTSCATPPSRSRRCSSSSTRWPSCGGRGAFEPAAMIGHSVGEYVAADAGRRHDARRMRCG